LVGEMKAPQARLAATEAKTRDERIETDMGDFWRRFFGSPPLSPGRVSAW
jgi:hypothetical protein